MNAVTYPKNLNCCQLSETQYYQDNGSLANANDDHPIYQFGYPKEGAAHAYEPEFVMVRTLQRYPNASVQKLLQRIHANMAEKFSGMSDEALDWLLGGSRLTARGGVKTVEELRQFLNTPSESIPAAQLVGQLEPILTAIGYRSIRAAGKERPFSPETLEQKAVCQVIDDIMRGQMVRSISTVYTQKNSDKSDDLHGEIVCEQDTELSDDEDNLRRGAPKERIPTAYFNSVSANNELSWVAQARAEGIHVRNHVSGTGPLCLAAAVGLLKRSDEVAIFSSEQEARDLFTTLIMPKFLRSDYHAIAETQAGIDHFVAENRNCLFKGTTGSTVISPKEASERAYEAMCRATSDESGKFDVTPSQAMRKYQSWLSTVKQRAVFNRSIL